MPSSASPSPGSPLRARRLKLGLTQSQLAQRAGVSRQLVAAVEAGRNAPAVDAALALARELGETVEALFATTGESAANVVPALGGRLADLGQPGTVRSVPVRVGRVGDRLVAVGLADHGVSGSGWAAADGELIDGRLSLFGDAAPAGLVLAGCEPALAVAERLLAGLGDRSLLAVPASTGAALRALRSGRVHGAVVHGPPGALPAAPVPLIRWRFAGWQVGLAAAATVRQPSLRALLTGTVPVAQREPAAASQQALERVRAGAGLLEPLSGPVTSGHIEAARTAAMLGCGALTTESAARAFGLHFDALEEHVVEIWIASHWAGHPGLQALGELLRGRAFQQRLTGLGGYDVTACGDAVTALG